MRPGGWRFAKYHGLGNDFLVGQDRPELAGELARAICDRLRGVGADGLMLLGRARQGIHPVRIVNADGSPASLSGNGLRCAAAFLLDSGEARGTVQLLATGGPAFVRRTAPSRYSLGLPIAALRKPADPPMATFRPPGGFPPAFGLPWHVVLGNPHAVFFARTVSRIPPEVAAACDRLRGRSRRFPDGVNVSLVARLASGSYRMRTWERGVGASPSCASAACAALYAGHAAGLLPASVRFVQDGGELEVETDGETIVLDGPIEHVFDGWVGIAKMEPGPESRSD